ncbi:hypothetical protein [Methylobacter tundripaludum]|nr:hypothetical protein [Methylobacter tundripaludum]
MYNPHTITGQNLNAALPFLSIPSISNRQHIAAQVTKQAFYNTETEP